MKNNTGGSSVGVSFFGLLAIVFIVLKLTGYIHWSWVWVLSPLWIPSLVILVVALVIYKVWKREDDKHGL